MVGNVNKDFLQRMEQKDTEIANYLKWEYIFFTVIPTIKV